VRDVRPAAPRPAPADRAEEAMRAAHRARYVTLHVRVSNRAALGLYRDALGFSVLETEKKYCACARASEACASEP
jgi:ribosomal protein S18 acetylase RimI-like enzyme